MNRNDEDEPAPREVTVYDHINQSADAQRLAETLFRMGRVVQAQRWFDLAADKIRDAHTFKKEADQ